ncbi:MAG: alpha/beta fold hydrolase [Acidobacteria bacterium]|nr:alpha/beta fold hydrolase [Acidobacteriota bacterium]
MAAPAIREIDIEANGLRFRALEAGAGPLALCLHGFPDSPWTYRHLLPELARAGYRAVAPWMRGYAPTAIPADNDFSTRALAADANGLHAALGGDDRAVLIAHDWGSAAAYGALTSEPGRWRRAVIMNVPPWAVFGQIAFRYDQLKRSFYFWLFQMGVAESIVGSNDLAFIESLWRDWSPTFDPTAEMPRVKACLRDPANLRAALGYYRDFFAPDRFGTPAWAEAQAAVLGRPVPQPVLYLHGTRDGCIALDAAGADAVRSVLSPTSEVERIPGVGHFMLVEAPRQIDGRIVRFVGSP